MPILTMNQKMITLVLLHTAKKMLVGVYVVKFQILYANVLEVISTEIIRYIGNIFDNPESLEAEVKDISV